MPGVTSVTGTASLGATYKKHVPDSRVSDDAVGSVENGKTADNNREHDAYVRKPFTDFSSGNIDVSKGVNLDA